LGDDQVSPYLSAIAANVPRYHRTITEFLVTFLGGPNIYTGQEISAMHKRMKVTMPQFNAVWNHLQRALIQYNTPPELLKEIKEIIYVLSDIIPNTPVAQS